MFQENFSYSNQHSYTNAQNIAKSTILVNNRLTIGGQKDTFITCIINKISPYYYYYYYHHVLVVVVKTENNGICIASKIQFKGILKLSSY